MTGDIEVALARHGTAAWITLNRPARRNALTPLMVTELHRALDRVEADPEAHVLVITGAPPAFCAGADLDFFRGRLDEPTAATVSWPRSSSRWPGSWPGCAPRTAR